ncbi:MAG: phosphoesterase [Pseudomonadota bacterium]|nr:phosphoesterase [Pseudomonadota bacterium]
MSSKFRLTALALAAMVATSGLALANEGDVPDGIPELDHVFVIMLENHNAQQIMGNPDAPFINSMLASPKVSYATNFYGVGHPSSTNYLETVGGSNFGVRSDNAPDWHNTSCEPNLRTGVVNADLSLPAPSSINAVSSNVCPIAGVGTDAETPAIDSWNEVTPGTFNFLANIDGFKSIPAAQGIDGKTIADQLAAAGGSWKTYQETLPLAGPDGVDYSNGTVTDANFAKLPNVANLPSNPGSYVKAYAAKHNPFVYFKSVQEGSKGLSFDNVRPFDGIGGLYADLATGRVPSFSFIAPNQCNDMHGRGNGDSFCGWDPLPTGTQVGLNPGLIAQGDATVARLVGSIKASPAWKDGRNAIVVIWDENDYSGVKTLVQDPTTGAMSYPAGTPFTNNVLVTVETNYRRSPKVVSNNYYNHFSLLRSIEGGLGLPCLNHACDANVSVMADMFAK